MPCCDGKGGECWRNATEKCCDKNGCKFVSVKVVADEESKVNDDYEKVCGDADCCKDEVCGDKPCCNMAREAAKKQRGEAGESSQKTGTV